MNQDDELRAVRVAELYYEDDKTQDEIGALLGISRWKVGRLLADARAAGIVRIEIAHPRARRLSVERQLRETFGLDDAVVVPSGLAPSDMESRVTQAAADYLAALRPVPRLLGVSWGRTIQAVAERLPRGWASGVDVVQVNGGVTLNRRPGTASATAVMIAQKADGHATLLPSPAILERLETKRAIAADRTVASVLDLATKAGAYLFSAGATDPGSAHVDSGSLTAAELAELERKGAVGDIVGRYIDADGNIVDPELDERTIGIALEQLRKAKRAIFVVTSERKHPIAHAVVASGLCTTVVTDEMTAAHLLEGARQ